MRSFACDFLFLVEQATVGGLAQETFENLVALGVVGLAHVLVPRGARAKHFEHQFKLPTPVGPRSRRHHPSLLPSAADRVPNDYVKATRRRPSHDTEVQQRCAKITTGGPN